MYLFLLIFSVLLSDKKINKFFKSSGLHGIGEGRYIDEKNWPVYEAVRDLPGEAREDFLTEAQKEVETQRGGEGTRLAWGYTRK